MIVDSVEQSGTSVRNLLVEKSGAVDLWRMAAVHSALSIGSDDCLSTKDDGELSEKPIEVPCLTRLCWL